MLCKVCNTRIHGGRSSCPNCGSHSVKASSAAKSEAVAKLPHLAMQVDPDDLPKEEPEELPKEEPEVVELKEPAAVEAEVDVALDEATAVDLNEDDEVEIEEPEARDDDSEAKEEPPPVVAAKEHAGFGTPTPRTSAGCWRGSPGC